MFRKITAVSITSFGLVLSLNTFAPATAQSVYSHPAPTPGQPGDSGNSPERLAEDSESIIYGAWDFTYAFTPDDNLFVTRTFIAFLDVDSIGMRLQIDCGRSMFRHVVSPKLFRGGETPGVVLSDVPINSWLDINRDVAIGRSMMRTCETAAREENIDWIWY